MILKFQERKLTVNLGLSDNQTRIIYISNGLISNDNNTLWIEVIHIPFK